MNPALRFLILGVVVCLAACDKEEAPEVDEALTFPVVANATAVESQGVVRLFTQDGEVKDQTVVDKFIAGAEGFNQHEVKPNDKITFDNDSTASPHFSERRYEVALKEGNKLVFTTKFYVEDEQQRNPLLEQFVLDYLRIAKTNVLHFIPTATGLRHLGEERWIAEGDYQSFLLPATVFKLSRRKGLGAYEDFYELNSMVASDFNEEFLETLKARDTIAYQESKVRFRHDVRPNTKESGSAKPNNTVLGSLGL